ncbi:MAG: UDP binding domain-containing protein, partial [Cloacibacillus sp.]
GKALSRCKIMLLGVAYKGDIDDVRESPALKVWEELENKGAKVVYHDPYCASVKWHGETVDSTPLTQETIQQCDAVLITTWHKHKVDYKMLLDNAPVIFDTKNAIVSVLGQDALDNKKLYRL